MQKLYRKVKIKELLTCVKYLFAIILSLYAWHKVGKGYFFAMGMWELAILFFLSNIFAHKKMGWFVNSILLLLYNVQMAVLVFANSYITMVMLTNIDSIDALSGKMGIYVTAIVLVLIFSFLPITKMVVFQEVNGNLFGIFLFGELLFLSVFGEPFSPFYGYVDLGIQQYESVQLQKEIAELKANGSGAGTEGEGNEKLKNSSFYKEGVVDYVEKDTALVEQPNIILIFTEGLSQNVISDVKNVMPNVREYQEKSLSFTNYFNHTFATYRGLIGQLYSGYQLENYDINPLVSLHGVLEGEGYQTAFVNTEPNNEEFTEYLNNFGFEYLYGDKDCLCEGGADSISDKTAYEMLFDIAEELNEEEDPFFLSIYTFGTHASLDSVDEKFGDGNDAELNKFYDADYQFGRFMEKFEASDLADNTIIVFTSDHATYQDDSYSAAFPDYERAVSAIDEIPLFIYYKGIEAQKIDVGGRNTICMTPTILDYLDISAENCFVGTSLFSEEANSFCETSYTDSAVMLSTRGGVIHSLSSEEEAAFNEIVKDYYVDKELLTD